MLGAMQLENKSKPKCVRAPGHLEWYCNLNKDCYHPSEEICKQHCHP